MKNISRVIFACFPLYFTAHPVLQQKIPYTISSQGLQIIKRFEGCSLRPYKDSGSVWTIGYGHEMVAHGYPLTITQEQANRLLIQDIQNVENSLNTLFDFRLTQNQVDALASFIFNIGIGNFKKSHVYAFLKQKDFTKAIAYWQLWVHDAHGNREPGLVKRREKETALFRSEQI